MALNTPMFTVISADAKGVIEYWDVDNFSLPSERIQFTFKMDTDLFDLAKVRTIPTSICISQQGHVFATLSRDKQLRVFDFATGKLRRKYDESNSVYSVSKFWK